MTGPIRHHAGLGRSVRSGDLRSQGESTYRLVAAAIEDGRFTDAAELGRFTIDEAREGYGLYPMFVERAREFLLREGMQPERLSEEEARILANLRLPGGAEFDLEVGWADYVAEIELFASACERNDEPAAFAALERARVTWRATHDRACDLVYGLLDVIARYLGEDRIGDAWDSVMAPLYPSRDRYDIETRPWGESVEELVLDAIASLRGHLSGPGRLGDVEVEEQADRWVLRFDPCGSGGRTLRPDPEEGSPPRMEPPFNYAVTTEERDWAWSTEGVCLYCVHCCQLQERVPIAKLGYPVRVVEAPVWPAGAEQKCTWSVYKDPSLVPEEAYRRVGAHKPKDQERRDP